MRTLTAGALALGLIAIAASAARADIFACVNNSSGTPKIVSSCTPGTNASPCHHNDTCEVLSASGTILQRLAADFQNDTTLGGEEVTTTATPAAGGLLVYSKTLSIPFGVAYITFSAQGDAHNGSALLMQASITDSSNTETICQPLAGQTGIGGGGPHLFPGWYTLLHLPETTASTGNCNDGGGGTADCHDNNIVFSCCSQITPDTAGSTHTVKIRLADLPGGDSNNAFYERSTIYVDGSPNPGGNLCTGVGLP